MFVILFDIDGTLVDNDRAGRLAMGAALAAQFDVPEPESITTAGRTDRGIAEGLFADHEIPHTEENWQRFHDAYMAELSAALPRRKGRVLPGIASLVAALQQRDDITLGLLTGNVRGGAQRKLEFYGLDQYFPFGGFGDQHLTRDLVAAEALAAAQRHLNRDLDPQQVWVIGDTPRDISCARSIGAKVLAVATGLYNEEELAAENPDILTADLADPAPLWNVLQQ